MPNPKTRSSRRGGTTSDFLAVLLLMAVVVGVGWLWWSQRHTSKSSTKAPAPVAPAVEKPKANPIIPSMVLVERKPEPVSPPPPLTPHENIPPVPVVPVVSNVPPPVSEPAYPRPARTALEGQVALARLAISPGSIDGAIGSQTRAAIETFQKLKNLTLTSALDTNTESLLTLDAPALTDYVVTSNDFSRLQPLGKTWLAKSEQSALDYETILQLVGEVAHSNPALIKKLNPEIDWSKVMAGTMLKIPAVEYPDPTDKAAYVVIHLSTRTLEAFGTESNLLVHFPCSIAAKVEKRPVGELHVLVIIPNPNYTFDPAIFPESPEAQAIGHKLILPPGPKNPVGVAWIGLDRPGYGMHGTPSPEQVGRTESHGCFRLANWDAAYMVKLVWVGMPVYVDP